MLETLAEPEGDIEPKDELDTVDDLLSDLEDLVDVPDDELVEAIPDDNFPEDLIDELGQYFHEISRQPLLSKEDEFRLFVLIEAGRRVKEYLNQWVIPDNQENVVNLSLNLYEKMFEIWEELRQICQTSNIPHPNLGEIFSEIFIQRIRREPYSSAALAEWFDILPTGSLIREQVGRQALEIPVSLMLLPVQAITWLSGHLAKDENSLPILSEFANWIIYTEKIEFETEEILEISVQAYEKMVLSNLRLVVWIAKKYQGRGVELADLVQAGSLGLLRAIDKFNPARGNRFSTYATWWVRQAVSRNIADYSRLIRIPVHVSESASHVLSTRDRLIQVLGRVPTPDEIAKEDPRLTPNKVELILKYTREPLSLDMKARDDGDSVLGDFISDNKPDLDTQIAKRILQETVPQVLDILSERERTLLELRFGLIDDIEHTLEEIGNTFDLTRERIRQIEAKALRKLRHPTRSRHLRDFLG